MSNKIQIKRKYDVKENDGSNRFVETFSHEF